MGLEMPKLLTTDTAIRKWTISKNEETYGCGGRLALFVRGYLSGRKTFYWRGKTWLKLGDYPALSLADARELSIACSKHSKLGVTSDVLAKAIAIRTKASDFAQAIRAVSDEGAQPELVRTYHDVLSDVSAYRTDLGV